MKVKKTHIISFTSGLVLAEGLTYKIQREKQNLAGSVAQIHLQLDANLKKFLKEIKLTENFSVTSLLIINVSAVQTNRN